MSKNDTHIITTCVTGGADIYGYGYERHTWYCPKCKMPTCSDSAFSESTRQCSHCSALFVRDPRWIEAEEGDTNA